MAAILNFQIFRKNCETQKYLYLENRNFLPAEYLCRVAIAIFKSFLSRQKWRPFWIFEFFAKKKQKRKNA